MSDQRPSPATVIGLRTAILLYAILLGCALWLLRGNARLVVAILIFGLAAKSVVHYLRERSQ